MACSERSQVILGVVFLARTSRSRGEADIEAKIEARIEGGGSLVCSNGKRKVQTKRLTGGFKEIVPM
jgi:hypothetical protein